MPSSEEVTLDPPGHLRHHKWGGESVGELNWTMNPQGPLNSCPIASDLLILVSKTSFRSMSSESWTHPFCLSQVYLLKWTVTVSALHYCSSHSHWKKMPSSSLSGKFLWNSPSPSSTKPSLTDSFLINSAQFWLVWCCGDVGRQGSSQVAHSRSSFLLMTAWIPSEFLHPGRTWSHAILLFLFTLSCVLWVTGLCK